MPWGWALSPALIPASCGAGCSSEFLLFRTELHIPCSSVSSAELGVPGAWEFSAFRTILMMFFPMPCHGLGCSKHLGAKG